MAADSPSGSPSLGDGAKARSRAGVAFILVVLVLDTLGIGIVVPVMPRLIASVAHASVSQGSWYYGGFIAVYAAMQIVAAPIIGGLSDRFGRRAVILSSLLGASLDYLLLAFAPNLGWLFVGRVFSGITGASFSAATAYIADVTPPEKRAQSFGLVGAAFGIGFIVGPALGGVLGNYHLRAPFLLAAALNGLNLIYGLFVLPESLAPENRRPFSIRRANPFGALKNLRRSPVLFGLSGTLITGFLAQQILQSVWALFTQFRFGWSALDVGLSLTAVGVASALIQGGLVRAVIPRLGERRTVVIALVFSVLGFAAFAVASKAWMMYAIIFPFALGGLAGPATQALLSKEVSASEQGELQGSVSSLQSMSAVFGPLIGTGLFARFSAEDARVVLPGAPFLAAACLNALGLAIAVRQFARRTRPART